MIALYSIEQLHVPSARPRKGARSKSRDNAYIFSALAECRYGNVTIMYGTCAKLVLCFFYEYSITTSFSCCCDRVGTQSLSLYTRSIYGEDIPSPGPISTACSKVCQSISKQKDVSFRALFDQPETILSMTADHNTNTTRTSYICVRWST